jgi:hypothetical protein
LQLAQKVVLFQILFYLIIPLGVAQESFDIEFTLHRNETADLKEFAISDDEADNYYGAEGQYTLQLIDEDQKVLWEQKRKINLVIYSNPPELIDKKVINSNIPFEKNATRFQLTRNGEVILNKNVVQKICTVSSQCTDYCSFHDASVVACTCGDNTCQSYENAEVCPQDCADQVDVDSPDTAFQGYWKYILIALALISAGLILLLKQYVQKERDSEEKEEGVETMNNRKYDDLDLDRYNRDSEG